MSQVKKQKANSLFKKILTLGGVFVVVFSIFKKRKEIKQVLDTVVDAIPAEMKNEFQKLEKQSEKNMKDLKKSLRKRFTTWLKDVTIPHAGNNHHPKALHPKALTSYVLIIFLVKVLVTGSLFFVYPNIGFVTSKITDDLYEITNQERVAAGLEPLIINHELVAAATRKVNDMVTGDYFAHISPDGTKPWEWINKDNYNFTHMGENLAMDFSSAKVVHSAFMKSPSHKANILNEDYTDFGMVIMSGVINGRETMILVQFYGKPKFTSTLATVNVNQVVSQPEVLETVVINNTQPNEIELVNQETTNITVQGIENSDATSSVEAIDNQEISEIIPVEPIATETVNNVNSDTEVAADSEQSNATLTLVGQIDEEINYIPNAELVVLDQPGVQKGLVDLLISWSRNFMTLMLVIVSMLLIVNVAVKIRIQHAHVIVHSLLVIGFIAIMLFTRVHVLERLIF